MGSSARRAPESAKQGTRAPHPISGTRIVAARPRKKTLPGWPPPAPLELPLEPEPEIDVAPAPASVRHLRIATRRAPRPARVAPESAWQAAARCAAELADAVGARAVLVHAHANGELRVIGAAGSRVADLLGATEPSATDFVARTLVERRSLTMCFELGLPSFAPRRLTDLGARRSLVAAPVRGPSLVGIVEAIDAREHLRLVVERCERIAERLADVLAAP